MEFLSLDATRLSSCREEWDASSLMGQGFPSGLSHIVTDPVTKLSPKALFEEAGRMTPPGDQASRVVHMA
jgi:hypothetical protein